ncbi:MAG: hypothetical protein HC802_07435 [Caldilineaceae bacterium]|nr:hypothetical protein [Caldilineaceae bacterium]
MKLLNRRLQALQFNQVELKKRGFPVEPEQLRARLKLTRLGRAGVVIFTRRGDQRIMCIGWRLNGKAKNSVGMITGNQLKAEEAN